MHSIRTILFWSAIAVFAASLAFGQAVNGTIVGTVTDPSGAVIAGAKVTLTELRTQCRQRKTLQKCDDVAMRPARWKSPQRWPRAMLRPNTSSFAPLNGSQNLHRNLGFHRQVRYGSNQQVVVQKDLRGIVR